jgi:hypothetical protein
MSGRRKQLWLALKVLLAVAILVGVARYFARIMSDEMLERLRIVHGQSVPFASAGDLIKVRTAGGTLVASGKYVREAHD